MAKITLFNLFLILTVTIFFNLLFLDSAWAQTPSTPATTATWKAVPFPSFTNPVKEAETLLEFTDKYVVAIIAWVGGVIFLFAIIIAGMQYLTAGGNEEQAKKAKNTLLWAIIGIIAIAVASAAVNWFMKNVGSSGPAPTSSPPVTRTNK